MDGSADVLRILLLEDSDIDAELLASHLARAGLNCRIDRAVNRREFVSGLEAPELDIIVADYSLPDFDGLSALSIARALRPEAPFLFVSGVVGEEFATNALKRGATDYVLKRNLSRLPTALERALAEAAERTERRRAEEALKASEINTRIAVEAAGLGLWDYRPPTDDLQWDPRCREMFGLEPDTEITLGVFYDRCHPDDAPRVQAAVTAALQPGGPDGISEEFRVRLPGGRLRWLSTRGHALFEDGRCVRLVGAVRDVTEEKLAQQAMQRLNESLEALVAERTRERDRIWRLSRDLFAVVDCTGFLRTVNPAWTTVLGYEETRLLLRPLTDLIHPEDLALGRAQIAALRRGAVVDRFECRVIRADGGCRWISWTAVPEGEVFYAVGRDVTEEKAAAEALAASNRELRDQIEERERVEDTLRQMQRLDAVGQLTSGVAHDFNNLLTVILGNADFLARGLQTAGVDGALAQQLGQIRVAAERGAKLTAQLLAFSRRQRLEPKPIDLNETVSGMRDMLQSTLGGSIRIETVLGPDVWPALVDPTQIELIILNLAINARDAMEVGGSLTLETANVTLTRPPARPEEPPPGDYVALSVNDTGPGMAEEVLAKAFEPFFTTKEIGKGSGLGLAQVYGFAKQSGGGVRIDTRPGEGTSVKVYLPRAEPAGDRPADRPASETVTRASSGRRILLVDDDSAVRQVTAAMLQELGYEVAEAGSGGAALELLRRDRGVALLLIDYAMPGMSGAETAQAAAAVRPGLPVLFITGYADLKALRQIGEDRIVQKPFQGDELGRKLQKALGAAPADMTAVPLADG
jgi:PAS domain S-box-containing protein